ncbi:ABC transporter permease [Mycolicibacterium komossense]|uniref:ABC transporter permease n=1 Tax=Mycolicibacterium komossense TaxID=1779 RepID=A0ABT3CK81_9MYCO|nr:ABC transporter permease [Mycolicibacterium komossense]MCV7229884.1 ABC transporter permease [Mycolicibacterium komossense]
MSAATLQRPPQPAHRASAHSSPFAGTFGLLRLNLRRDRVTVPLWILLLSVPLSTVYVGGVDAVYPTVADRANFAASIMASPAQRALYGNIYNDSLGAVGIWKAGIFHLLIAVAAILTMIRHTRADEETGRAELVGSTAVGRCAGLTAALLLTSGAAVLTGLIGSAGLLTLDIPAMGSVAFGLALAGSGLVFTAVAAVTAQLSPSARVARGAAFGLLAAAFTLRAVGDAGNGALSWLSPLGWSLKVKPYAGDHFWVLTLPVAAATVLTLLAFRLLARRDVGAGLIAERLGPATARLGLRSPLSLAWRLDRGALILWTVGLCIYGLLVGSVTNGIGDEIGTSGAAREIVARLGGTDAVEQAFITVAFAMLAMVAAAFATSLSLRLHQEEASQRAEPVLAGAVSRNRWLASHLGIAVIGSAVAIMIAGLVTGLTYGIAAHDIGGKLPTVLATAAVQLPVVWLLAAVTVALFGVVPRFTPVAWGVLVGFIALYLLGSLSGAPQWILDLGPFAHTPRVGVDFTATPLVWLLAVDTALITLGAFAFRRRDLR